MQRIASPKLNRFLAVLGRRDDGFHALELVTTVLEGASECQDLLEVAPAETLGLTLTGPEAGGLTATPENLVLRAWKLLEQTAGCALPAHLTLRKGIPHGAGLGGGSSDAAAALELGNTFHQLGLSMETLLSLGARLGSDVPLFLLGGTVLGLDRGERVLPLHPVPLEPLVIVHPALQVPTPQVYQALPQVGYPPVQPLPSLPVGTPPPWRNDLTAAALAVCPALAEVRDALARTGGEPLLCGSGACWAARYPAAAHADNAVRDLHKEFPHWKVWRW